MERQTVTFFFEGRRLRTERGASVAKALFDAGIKTLSYSVKYKRPRGIHCARGRCVMCHMEVDGIPGVPTCITPVEERMQVRRENFRPFFAPFLISAVRSFPFPAGFYYRMFTRPAFLRRMFLGSLRRMAGVGRLKVDGEVAPRASTNPTRKESLRESYDVVVVGAGLSGMSAAHAAARSGASVLLVDEYESAGGHAIGFHDESEIDSVRDDLVAKTMAQSSIDYRTQTAALAFYPPDTMLLGSAAPTHRRQHAAYASASARSDEDRTGISTMQRVRAPSFVFATGAYDVVPLFNDNDTPGIFGERAIRLLIERDRLVPGTRAVVYGTGTALRELAHFLVNHDIEVVAAVDGAAAPVAAEDRLPAGVRCLYDSKVSGAEGGKWLSAVSVASRKANEPSQETRISCDLLCTAFQGQGAYELPYQAGFEFEMSQDAIPENRVMLPHSDRKLSERGVEFFIVGELAGQRSWREKITAGSEAGEKAAQTRQPSEKD